MSTIVSLKHVKKSFSHQPVLRDVSFTIEEGAFVAITGSSGCGKSTLLNLIGLLDRPDAGELTLFGISNISPFSSRAQRLLKEQIGYLFQNFALLENKSVRYNLQIIMERKMSRQTRDQKIREALSAVGFDGSADKLVCQCSGGEQQRIAVARLLLKPCSLILADEPTGNLDEANRERVFDLLKMMNEQGKTIILVTHDKTLADRCDRCLYMTEGKVSRQAIV